MMLFAVLLALSLGLTQSRQELAPSAPRDRAEEIADLVQSLAPGLVKDSKKRLSIGRSLDETIEIARAQLVIIANESPESRRDVIEALIPILNDPKTEYDLIEVGRWRASVELLGELKATEAIDDLVRNINVTSYYSNPHPTHVRDALVRIGEPAIPSLLNALSDPLKRFEVPMALSEIGEPSINGLLDVLSGSSATARMGAAEALARIGGPKAREAILIAITVETDKDVRVDLENMLCLLDHIERLRASRTN